MPRVLENGIIYETTFFRALGQEIRTLTAKLGFTRTQELVGRAELLEQTRGLERLDLAGLLAPLPGAGGAEGRRAGADHPQAPQLPHRADRHPGHPTPSPTARTGCATTTTTPPAPTGRSAPTSPGP